MALHGNLRDFSLSQLFNIISLAKKIGVLVFDCGTEIINVYIKGGNIISSEVLGEDNSLASVLYLSNHINKKQFTILKDKAGNLNDKELGIILVNAGYVRQEEIIGYYHSYYLSIIKRLYTKKEGKFYFDPNRNLNKGKINVLIKLDKLIIESSRYLETIEYIKGEIPSLDMSLKFKNAPRYDIEDINLSPDEWRVVSFIKPEMTIKEIANMTNMGDDEIRRVVYSLIQLGIIEVVRPMRSAYSMKVQPYMGGENRIEQKRIVSKLIDRIKAL